MRKLAINLFLLFGVLTIVTLIGCASGTRGKLKRVQQPPENELKQNWQNYTVYHRHNLAFVYKIKNTQTIILDKRWVEVSSEEMMAKSKILFLTDVREILGKNDKLFGYLVHRYQDQGYVGIIDENTVKLRYRYVVTETGH
jgi:hypothetical protein